MHTFENREAETSTQPAASSGGSRSRSKPRNSSDNSRRLSPRGSDPMTNTAAQRVAVLPPELRRRVDAELAGGERIVWLGQPVPSLFGREGWGSVVVGIPWTA